MMCPPNADSNLNEPFPSGEPVNISRRRFLIASAGTAAGALVLGFGLPLGGGRVEAAEIPAPIVRGTRVPAFLEIRPDNTVRLLSPFIEGGQGTFTAMAQIVGEELDADPATFVVENAPPGDQFVVLDNGLRITGGSMSVRLGYPTMRRLGALGRAMLLQAASERLGVPVGELSTEPGNVVHKRTGQTISYGELAERAMDLPVPDPDSVKLKDPSEFRWIGKPIARLDAHEKSTGQIQYSVDIAVEGMLHAAVQHAPRLGMTVKSIRNADQTKSMKGVHSLHILPGAIAVVAERWWHAKRAAEAVVVEWQESTPESTVRDMPADFSTVAFRKRLADEPGKPRDSEVVGDVDQAFKNSKTLVEATYHSQNLNHAQMEPPSALARFDPDGNLEIWLPNQAPDMYLKDIAKRFSLDPSKIIFHSPLLGGFFGRHSLYDSASPFPQAIQLAKETGRPIKLIWSREEEFLRDALRPMAVVKFKAAIDEQGYPVAIQAVSATEGVTESLTNKQADQVDRTALEGLTKKAYAIPHRRISQLYVRNPVVVGYWRSVGNSMNDFLYESFLDELADKGDKDPFELRMRLLEGNERLTHLLTSVADLSGGWKRGPFIAEDGSKRARGVAMASPFGTETAVIAEVSIVAGKVKVHDIWQAIDPGSIVNPAIVEAQVNGATALGLSQVLLEDAIYENGIPRARNYDLYPILSLQQMPRVHVQVIESGAKMGGVGEPPLPAVAPAVANAVSRLTGERIRSMPLSQYTFKV